MTAPFRRGLHAALALGVCFGFAANAQSQELDEAVRSAWTAAVAQSLSNPPERGAVAVDVLKGAPRVVPATGPTLNRYLSLLVTDVDTVSAISFSAVMGQLAKDSGDPLFGKEMLFHQWWDTANKKPGLLLGPHCDDSTLTDKLKGFPYTCPRLEGNQATDLAVFKDEGPDLAHNQDAYSAIAVSNRFDLLSPPQKVANGQVVYPDCGEYRIIFAVNSGKTTPPSLAPDQKLHPGDIFNRNLISFEFRIKNPDAKPQRPGVPSGCMPIQKFWYSLSDASVSGQKRGELLRDFFMDGKIAAPGGQTLGPPPGKVVAIRNLAFDSGQIRTNQFLNTVTVRPPTPPTQYSAGIPGSTKVEPNDWLLREFRTLAVGQKVLIVPVTTKSAPGSALFKPVPTGGANDPRLVMLLQDIRSQVKDLLGGGTNDQFSNIGNINSILFSVLKPDANAFQSDEGSPVPCSGASPCSPNEGDIFAAYSSGKNDMLDTDVADDLVAANAPAAIRVPNVVDRLRTQTCAGCHQFSDTKKGTIGFDSLDGLGGGAHWPTKACGDYDNCSISTFLITDPKKQHPPMEFTQVSELILTASVADGGKGWRYAISSTVECMLDYREKFMETALGLAVSNADNCPH